MKRIISDFVCRGRVALLLLLTVAAIIPASADGWRVPEETLSYDVMYKWGLINKKAGTVTITTSNTASDRFLSNLSGRTAPWADHIYKVRDTLRGTIDSDTFFPYTYEKIAHEDGDFSHDHLVFSRSGNTTTAKVVRRKKRKKDKTEEVTNRELEATGPTLDMLSAFYYMRKLDYDKMAPGETVRLNVFSGRQKEILKIHFDGTKEIKVGKKRYKTYHITFTFTSKAGKKTSDNMDAWISATPERVPLLLEGRLPVGKVRAVYSGKMPA